MLKKQLERFPQPDLDSHLDRPEQSRTSARATSIVIRLHEWLPETQTKTREEGKCGVPGCIILLRCGISSVIIRYHVFFASNNMAVFYESSTYLFTWSDWHLPRLIASLVSSLFLPSILPTCYYFYIALFRQHQNQRYIVATRRYICDQMRIRI